MGNKIKIKKAVGEEYQVVGNFIQLCLEARVFRLMEGFTDGPYCVAAVGVTSYILEHGLYSDLQPLKFSFIYFVLRIQISLDPFH